MANNRMYLVHKKTGQSIFIAKYFPQTGWFTTNENLTADLNKEFNKQDFGDEEWHLDKETSIGGYWGSCDWQIKYEHDGKFNLSRWWHSFRGKIRSKIRRLI